MVNRDNSVTRKNNIYLTKRSMALRAFHCNPSIGGFGSESNTAQPTFLPAAAGLRGRIRSQSSSLDFTPTSHTNNVVEDDSSGDAFAQIVKELVDNAIDACAVMDSEARRKPSMDGGANDNDISYKRVRVKIEEEKFKPTDSSFEVMDCLRITVSDNGCGMEDIDRCVTIFSSKKTDMRNNASDSNSCRKSNEMRDDAPIYSNRVKGNKNQKEIKVSKKIAVVESNRGFTSGRYGIGLTLCLLHAQRLVPGSGACITSATVASRTWARATYQVDTDADEVRCRKREEFAKDDEADCGTIVSLLVPGGSDVYRAWPRLAEYFARFQLSIELACSLEVLAPPLSRKPLMIRPPSEMNRRSEIPSTIEAEAITNSEHNCVAPLELEIHNDWDGDDGFREDMNDAEHHSNFDSHKPMSTQKLSKACEERERNQQEKRYKISVICNAAEAYMGRPVSAMNVAFDAQPIRQHCASTQHCSSEDVPYLEISIVVYGPNPEDVIGKDSRCELNQSDRNLHSNHRDEESFAHLRLVRMVNGVPLLDSPEAIACGIVQKLSNNSPTWNSFGLDVILKNKNDPSVGRSGSVDFPTFQVKDIAQVASFFRDSMHEMFHDQSQDSSSDDDSVDPEAVARKRKKQIQAVAVLPAALRLGEALIVVQILAKPSSLPLPTLSKGRLPLNDRGINDALENGLTSCLRSLQQTNPNLLLTAHQLKRVERDSKYVPAVAGAIASVLGRSEQIGLYMHTMNLISKWDDDMNNMCISPFEQVNDEGKYSMRRRRGAKSTNPHKLDYESELCKVESLRSILERRLKFVVSEEFKDAKKEKIKKDRGETAKCKRSTKYPRKRCQTDDSFGMNSDCFQSDDSIERRSASLPHKCTNSSSSEFESGYEGGQFVCFTDSDQSEAQCDLVKKSINEDSAAVESRDAVDSDKNTAGTTHEGENPSKPLLAPSNTNGLSSSDDEWSAQYGIVAPDNFFK